MKLRVVGILSMLLSTIVILFPFPPAAAGGAIVQAATNPVVCTSSCSATFGSNVVKGHWIVAFLMANAGGAVTCGTITVTSISDTVASTFTFAKSDCIQTADINTFAYIAQIAASGADQINTAVSGTVFANGGQLVAFEVNAPTGAPSFLASNGHSISTTSAGTADSFVPPNAYFGISAITTGTSVCSTAQGGQSQFAFGVGNCWFNVGAGIGSTSVGFATESALANPTTFPWTAANADWGEVAIMFGVKGGVTLTSVVACTFFQLQCWAYPMIFLGMYLGFIAAIAMGMHVSDKTFMYLLVSVGSFASWVLVQQGTMTPMVPVLMVVGNIVYSTGLGGRIMQLASGGKGVST